MDLIRNWMKEKWKTNGHAKVTVLPRDFLLFSFSNEDDVANMLKLRPCFFHKKALILKRWHKGFGPETENLDLVPLWEYLPNHPIEVWNMNIIVGIAKVARTLVSVDNPTKSGIRMMKAHFCVNVDISMELPN